MGVRRPVSRSIAANPLRRPATTRLLAGRREAADLLADQNDAIARAVRGRLVQLVALDVDPEQRLPLVMPHRTFSKRGRGVQEQGSGHVNSQLSTPNYQASD